MVKSDMHVWLFSGVKSESTTVGPNPPTSFSPELRLLTRNCEPPDNIYVIDKRLVLKLLFIAHWLS